MGYDVHITRAPDWTDSESNPIRLDEWKSYVTSDPEFRLDGVAETTTARGQTIRYEREGIVVWTAYSGYGEGAMAWFVHRYGRIVVKNPDDEILGKMKEIASVFQARVVGDEGEEL